MRTGTARHFLSSPLRTQILQHLSCARAKVKQPGIEEDEMLIHEHCERTELYSLSARTHSYGRHSLSSMILHAPRPTVLPCFSTPPRPAVFRIQVPRVVENEPFEVSSLVVRSQLGNGLTSLARDHISFRTAKGVWCSHFYRPVISPVPPQTRLQEAWIRPAGHR